MSLASSIAKIGQSADFITAMAHAGFAYSVLATCAYFGLTLWVAVPVFMVLVGVKEFYMDVTFEKNPPQTLLDGAQDFLEYMGGVVVAALIFKP